MKLIFLLFFVSEGCVFGQNNKILNERNTLLINKFLDTISYYIDTNVKAVQINGISEVYKYRKVYDKFISKNKILVFYVDNIELLDLIEDSVKNGLTVLEIEFYQATNEISTETGKLYLNIDNPGMVGTMIIRPGNNYMIWKWDANLNFVRIKE